MGDFIINGKTVASLQIGGKEVIRIADGQTVLWEKVTPVAPTLVDYVHTSSSSLSDNFISTGVYPTTDTVYRIVYKPNSAIASTLVGFDDGNTPTRCSNDSTDYRCFYWNRLNNMTSDYNSSRFPKTITFDGDGYADITVGNNYITDNLAQSTQTGTTQSTITPNIPIYLNVSSRLDFQSLEIWENNTKVYDGHAAVDNGTYGVYDSIGGTFTTQTYGGNSMTGGNLAPDINEVLCFTANSANSTIGLENGPNNSPTLYYSTDNGTSWSQWDYSTITLQSVGDKVYFYGDNPNGVSTSRNAYSSFKTTNGSCTVSGNIMSLIHYSCPNTIPNAYCFNGLFQSTTITSAANLILPATTLTDHCYAWMFWNCSNLVTPPQLPSTTLATYCYFAMFFGNSSLTSAPALNAATLLDYSYAEMFDGCSLLNSITCLATDVSATHSTYYWLNDVAQSGTFTKDSSMSSWTTGTSGIPTGWTVQNTNDYLCFTVETAPFTFNLGGKGNAVVYYSTDKTNWNLLSNYSDVTLQNVGDKVYFYGNNPNGFSYSQNNFDKFHTSAGSYSVSGNIMSLIDISCPSTIPNSYCFAALFSGTSIVSAEHLLLPAQTLTDHCYFDMFARSTLSTPPELPATTLAESCYAFMFDDTDITESPILAVGILPQSCYYRMFRNCSNLNTVTCLATDITAQYCTQNWLENVPATGTFTKDSSMTSWTTGASGIPSGWTVQDYQ